ncbi:MAG: ribosomal protein S18-alanine N-acetyltransferase [Gammaproteobacteria bacterium]|nr:ribosomal protein S18-alanine N-acetyltransferase [Gammaproteobacteria bacterium]
MPLDQRRLRPMTLDDLPAVMALERLAHSHPWTEGIMRDCLKPGYSGKLLEWDGPLLGFGIWLMQLDECHILNLCIDPSRQRQGHGRYLLQWMLRDAIALGARMSLLEVRVNNRAAIALYEAMGYAEIGLRPGYYPSKQGREDGLVMALDLQYLRALPETP